MGVVAHDTYLPGTRFVSRAINVFLGIYPCKLRVMFGSGVVTGGVQCAVVVYMTLRLCTGKSFF